MCYLCIYISIVQDILCSLKKQIVYKLIEACFFSKETVFIAIPIYSNSSNSCLNHIKWIFAQLITEYFLTNYLCQCQNSLPQKILYSSHLQELAHILQLKIIPSPERAVTIPGVCSVLCYNKSGTVTARSGDGMILCFKMSAGSWKWDKSRFECGKLF